MDALLLTLLRFGLLALLYLFLARTLRVVMADLYGPRRSSSPAPRSAGAERASSGPPRTKTGRSPRELVVHSPTGSAQVLALSGRGVTFGRSSEVDVVLDDVYVSDAHAEIVATDGGYEVRDLGSTNGTFLNGNKVSAATALTAGDQIRLGKTRVEVRR